MYEVRIHLSSGGLFLNLLFVRPSQVASEPTTVLAQRLTQSLHTNGDIDVIDPHSYVHYSENREMKPLLTDSYV